MQIDKNSIQNYRWTKDNLFAQHLSIPSNFFKYRQNVCLKNGTDLHIRPVRGEDESGLAKFFEMLSGESIFFRFGSRRIYMPHDRLILLCQVDYDRDFAFLAVVPGEQEHIIGEVRLNRLSEFETAELSFVIADQWQGKGVGSLLMDFCLAVAREIGLTTVLMEVMKSNVRMIQFGYKYHFRILPGNREDDMKMLELKIGSENKFFDHFRQDSSVHQHNRQLISGTRQRQQIYH